MLNASNEYEVPVHDVSTSLFWSDVQLQCLPQHSAPPGSGQYGTAAGGGWDGAGKYLDLSHSLPQHNTLHCFKLAC